MKKLETESVCIILVGRSYVKEQQVRLKAGVAFEDYNTGEVHESKKVQDGLETLRTQSKNEFWK